MSKNIISNEEMITGIKKYFFEINHEQIKCLQYTKIAKYLSKETNSDIKEYDIRRNKEITKYILKLKSKDRKVIESNAIVFVPLDVTQFIHKNSNISSLKKALLERDQYYKNVCQSAFRISIEDNQLNKKVDDLITENKSLKIDIHTKTEQLNIANMDIKNLKNQLNKMKEILNNSVYPEIANELLHEIGLLKSSEDIINTSSYPVIEDTDSIIKVIEKNEELYSDNNVIQGLFNKL